MANGSKIKAKRKQEAARKFNRKMGKEDLNCMYEQKVEAKAIKNLEKYV